MKRVRIFFSPCIMEHLLLLLLYSGTYFQQIMHTASTKDIMCTHLITLVHNNNNSNNNSTERKKITSQMTASNRNVVRFKLNRLNFCTIFFIGNIRFALLTFLSQVLTTLFFFFSSLVVLETNARVSCRLNSQLKLNVT